MAALKKGVAFSVGLVTASCSINGAVEPKVSNTNVCCGPDTTPHDATQLKQQVICTTCHVNDLAAGKDTNPGVVPYEQIKKARLVGNDLVLITADEIAAAKGDTDKYKTAVALTPHPAATVYARTAPGEKAYYVTPDPGHEVAYALLLAMIAGHPELAFVGQWTPRSNSAQFRVIVRDGCLMMTELVREQSLKPVPAVSVTAPEPMLAMAEQVLTLPGVVTDYDPDTYADKYEENVQALLATKAPSGTATTTTTTKAPAIPASQAQAMAALEAMLAAAAPTAKKPRAKKVSA